MVERTAQFLRLRAACALLILLIGGPLAPIVSAAGMSVDCSMACCIEDGYCCCNSEEADGVRSAERAEVGSSQAVKRCPDDCSAPGHVSRLQSRDALRAAPYIVGRAAPPAFNEAQDVAPARNVRLSSSVPRAPPAFFSASSCIA